GRDDLGDLRAFAAAAELAEDGSGLRVAERSAEAPPELLAEADLVVDGRPVDGRRPGLPGDEGPVRTQGPAGRDREGARNLDLLTAQEVAPLELHQDAARYYDEALGCRQGPARRRAAGTAWLATRLAGGAIPSWLGRARMPLRRPAVYSLL